MTSELKKETIHYIDELLTMFDTTCIAEKFYNLIVTKGGDEVKIRNSMIIRDFDKLFKDNSIKVCSIYDDLAHKYDVSTELIRYVIKNRRLFKIW